MNLHNAMFIYSSTAILGVTTIYTLVQCYFSGEFDVLWLNRCLFSVVFSFSVAGWGLKRKSLNWTGAVGGIFVGLVLTFSSYCFMACLLTFFYTSSKATQLYSDKKRKLENDYKEGGQRNWIQVLCNGGTATEFALLYVLHSGVGECALEFDEGNFVRSWLSSAVLAALAGANGDTWASEIGGGVTRDEPRLITSFQKVPIGTNGGVSLIGIGASALGGAVVGLAYFVTLLLVQTSARIMYQAFILLFVGTFAGLFGSLLDSVIGATLQYSGIDTRTGRIVEHPGPCVKQISGRQVLNNHSVNMIVSIVNSLVVPTVTAKLYTLFL